MCILTTPPSQVFLHGDYVHVFHCAVYNRYLPPDVNTIISTALPNSGNSSSFAPLPSSGDVHTQSVCGRVGHAHAWLGCVFDDMGVGGHGNFRRCPLEDQAATRQPVR
jgi:hypothetical protein